MKKFYIGCCMLATALFGAGSCGKTADSVDGAISDLRKHRDQLCSNPVVHKFRSLIINRDAITGQETLNCFIDGKPLSSDRSYSAENRLKTEAETLFFKICKEGHTQKAHILIKGRQIGIIKRRCIK